MVKSFGFVSSTVSIYPQSSYKCDESIAKTNIYVIDSVDINFGLVNSWILVLMALAQHQYCKFNQIIGLTCSIYCRFDSHRVDWNQY